MTFCTEWKKNLACQNMNASSAVPGQKRTAIKSTCVKRSV